MVTSSASWVWGRQTFHGPWHFDASTFRTPEDYAVRRRWYLQALEWLADSRSSRAACFWTAGQYDILGILDARWRDDDIVEAVRAISGFAVVAVEPAWILQHLSACALPGSRCDPG